MAKAAVRVLDVSRILRLVFVGARTRMGSLYLDPTAVNRCLVTREKKTVHKDISKIRLEYAQILMLTHKL